MQGSIPKEAVADVEGQTCTLDKDCPCWGEIEGVTTAYGIGVSQCKANVCDTTYCVDVQPVGDWVKENPLNWIKDNIMLTLGILVLLLSVLFWPKR